MGRYKLPYSVFKRGKYYYYRTYTADGVRTVAKSTGCKTKGDAVRYCEGLYLSGSLQESDISFYNFAHNFYDNNSLFVRDRSTPISNNTLNSYQSIYNTVLEPYFKNYKLKDINYIELKKFRLWLMDNGYTNGTVRQYLTTLKNIINSAYKQDIITRNPFEKLDAIEIGDSKKEAFTLEQVKLVYDTIDQRYKNIVLLLALTGMRINEALGVTPDDIYQTKKTYYIKLDKQKNGEVLKTKKGRVIPITKEIKDIITNHNLYYYEVYKWVKDITDNVIKNEHLSIHSFRHFFITSTKAHNISTVKVKVISGHALNKVESAYTNFTPDDLIDVLEWQKEIYKYITE